VRIAASASERGRVAATGRLTVEGQIDAVLSVADRLADPRSGVLVQRAILAESRGDASGVTLEVDGVTVRSGP
jgi:hypothetical protein